MVQVGDDPVELPYVLGKRELLKARAQLLNLIEMRIGRSVLAHGPPSKFRDLPFQGKIRCPRQTAGERTEFNPFQL